MMGAYMLNIVKYVGIGEVHYCSIYRFYIVIFIVCIIHLENKFCQRLIGTAGYGGRMWNSVDDLPMVKQKKKQENNSWESRL